MSVLNLLKSPMAKISKNIESGFNLESALEETGLNWTVRSETMETESGIIVPGKKVIIREDNNKVLGVVGEKYGDLDNADAFGHFKPLLDSGKAELTMGGAVAGGKKVFLQAKLSGESMVVKGDDVVDKFLLLTTSHDGTSSLKLIQTPIRMSCQNQLAMMTTNAKAAGRLLKFQHTPKIHEQLEVVAAVLKDLDANFEKTLEAYRVIANKEVTSTKQLKSYIHSVLGLNTQSSPKEVTHITNTTEKIVNLFETGRGTTGTEKTLWRAYNAVNEWVGHEVGRSDEGRFNSLISGTNGKLNNRALELALKLAA